jgi:hypothetical protein
LPEGNGDVLLANAQKATDADDDRNSLTIAVQQHVIHVTNPLVVRAVDRCADQTGRQKLTRLLPVNEGAGGPCSSGLAARTTPSPAWLRRRRRGCRSSRAARTNSRARLRRWSRSGLPARTGTSCHSWSSRLGHCRNHGQRRGYEARSHVLLEHTILLSKRVPWSGRKRPKTNALGRASFDRLSVQ